MPSAPSTIAAAAVAASAAAAAAAIVLAHHIRRRRRACEAEVALDALWRSPAAAVVQQLECGQVTPAKLIDVAVRRIAATNAATNAVVTLCEERARARAASFAQSGGAPGPLFGLPVLVKDNQAVAGVRCTAGAPMHATRIAATTHPLVEALEAAGGVVLGVTNMPEHAAGSHTFNPVFGATHNPHDLGRTAGGSTGGSAAALASGAAWLATGSDLGGSLRNPAAFCSVVGLRPSPGRCPQSDAAPTAWRGRFVPPAAGWEPLACPPLPQPPRRGYLHHGLEAAADVFRTLRASRQQALPARERARQRMHAAALAFLREHDLLVCPCTLMPPFRGELRKRNTLGTSLLGLPVGVQLVGQPGGEAALLAAGALLERAIRREDAAAGVAGVAVQPAQGAGEGETEGAAPCAALGAGGLGPVLPVPVEPRRLTGGERASEWSGPCSAEEAAAHLRLGAQQRASEVERAGRGLQVRAVYR
ncbi:hypothetical protein EMIHUDRAFT_456188 [Emiliania huxleyi CCMP1516]|uniref:Amidase domain-containing protein n=2 Tax=Emiliania huxleyi TaxID=2903 RepID=A0A0D3K7Z6_EMIH1|nr:hypothetical protein EMIHUDRAFT_456188 [Emiliania huxleyi CCMP1516]EOD31881.1 hypothetical protein EMIHUDRAFT_456188 [Emiliania huxleyi CCMP1516]|eukprot:XP_005784310.1 hypothetical protein EMIHUDRAFT_456188 [Emiliania huxleyi CCMP1516]